jgi:hypothetical protein
MRGLDEVPVSIPWDTAESPTFGPTRPGPKKKLTPSANTSISAIAVIDVPEEAPQLTVYHNPYSAVRLEPEELSGSDVRHVRMKPDESGWDLVPT